MSIFGPRDTVFRLEGEEKQKFSLTKKSVTREWEVPSLLPKLDTDTLLKAADDNARQYNNQFDNLMTRHLQLKAFTVNPTVKKIRNATIEEDAAVAIKKNKADSAAEKNVFKKMEEEDGKFLQFLEGWK